MANKLIEEMGIRSFLENLVGKRFNFDELKNYIRVNARGYKLELVRKDMTDYDIDIDYMLIGALENKELVCEFDIYYAITRADEMYITEVGYEFN